MQTWQNVRRNCIPSYSTIPKIVITRGRSPKLWCLRPKDLHSALGQVYGDCPGVSVCTIQVLVVVRLPTVGEYGLQIYACEPRRDGDTYTHICQYLVVFTDVGTLDDQVLDRLDAARHDNQADPVLSTTPHSQDGSSQCSGGPEKPMHQDLTLAKDRQLQVRKEDTSVSSELLHTSVGLPLTC